MSKFLKKILFVIPITILLLIIGFVIYHNIKINKGKDDKNKDILLSIIVPVYNVENYIPNCLDHLINQTYKNIEIICVNDGSEDNSLKILNQYKNRDNRVILIDKKNGGVSSARNAGIDASNGEFITFVDADDYIDIDAYENCINIITATNADILAFGYIQEPKVVVIKPYENYKIYNAFDCMKNEFTANCTVWNKIFKRSLLFDENMRFADDVVYGEDDLFLKMVTPNAKKIVGCAYAYYHYNYRETSAENTYSTEKRLISAINRCNHLINYYTNKEYNEDEWLLTHCLGITYSRINSLNDNEKKKYSKQLLTILENKLLKKITNISEDNNNCLNQLRVYASM